MVFIICLYTVFAIQAIIFLLCYIISSNLKQNSKKPSTLVNYSLKIVALYAVLINTILPMPWMEIIASGLYCNSKDNIHQNMTCYSGIYFLHAGISALSAIMYLISLVVFTLFYVDINPFSILPFAGPINNLPLQKLVMKLVLPLYFVVDYKGSFNQQFSAIAGLYWAVLVFTRYQAQPMFHKGTFRFILATESILLWAAAVVNIHNFLDQGPIDNTGVIFMLVASPLIAIVFISIVETRYWGCLKSDIKSFKKDEAFELYTIMLLGLIINKDDPINRIKLEGILKFHTKLCGKTEDCKCSALVKENIREDSPKRDELWYTWARDILNEGLAKFEKSTKLHLLNAFIHQEQLNNKYKALYELMTTDDSKPQLQEEFSIFREKILIEDQIVEIDALTSEAKGIDVNIMVHFQNKFVGFQTSIEKSVNYHLDFWRELLEDNPDIQKLQSLGSKIAQSLDQVADSFKKTSELNPNHIKMLRIYGNFLLQIVNDDTEGKKLLEKADYIERSSQLNKQFIDNERLKYGENSNTCIITCSGNSGNLGNITNSNNEITRILQFPKPDMISQNISRIMPKIIGDSHHVMMKRYFESSEKRVIGDERVVFPVNKGGYMVPCTLMIKVLPTLDDGIRVVGFLKDIENGASLHKDLEIDNEDNVIITLEIK